MTLTLGDQILRLYYEHEALTGDKPTKLLIGKAQRGWRDELVKEMNRYGFYHPPSTRLYYRGLAIYEVDDASYLAVI